MRQYFINIRTYTEEGCQSMYLPVSGIQAAWDAYHAALTLAQLTDSAVALVDGETGEVIEDNEGTLAE